MKLAFHAITLTVTFVMTFIPVDPAMAQSDVAEYRGTQIQLAENARATTDLRARLVAIEQRIAEGRRNGAIAVAHAAKLRKQVRQVQTSMTRLEKQQTFVSAGELASYSRTLGAIDVDLDNQGVPRGYGNDMLTTSDTKGNSKDYKYNCQNESIAIDIPSDRLEVALDRLRLTTHCPISGTELARGRRSQPVVGTMTPYNALKAMLAGTGLQGRVIKQGLEVSRQHR